MRLSLFYPNSCTASRNWYQAHRSWSSNARLLAQLLTDAGIPSPASFQSNALKQNAINQVQPQTEEKKENVQMQDGDEMHNATGGVAVASSSISAALPSSLSMLCLFPLPQIPLSIYFVIPLLCNNGVC